MKKTIRESKPPYAFHGYQEWYLDSRHGYQEWYLDSRQTKLWYRCNMVRNLMIGYAEHHRIKQCIYHIK